MVANAYRQSTSWRCINPRASTTSLRTWADKRLIRVRPRTAPAADLPEVERTIRPVDPAYLELCDPRVVLPHRRPPTSPRTARHGWNSLNVGNCVTRTCRKVMTPSAGRSPRTATPRAAQMTCTTSARVAGAYPRWPWQGHRCGAGVGPGIPKRAASGEGAGPTPDADRPTDGSLQAEIRSPLQPAARTARLPRGTREGGRGHGRPQHGGAAGYRRKLQVRHGRLIRKSRWRGLRCRCVTHKSPYRHSTPSQGATQRGRHDIERARARIEYLRGKLADGPARQPDHVGDGA